MSQPSDVSSLPPPRDIPFLAGPSGAYILRPWFDRVTIRWVTRVFFPVSRVWAAARYADGSHDVFLAQLPLHRPPGAILDRLLEAVQRAEQRYKAATQDWHRLYFEIQSPTDRDLSVAETTRERAAQSLMLTRVHAAPLRLRHKLPRVAFNLATPAEVEATHAARLQTPEAAFPPPSPDGLRQSHGSISDYGRISWLEWPSCLGDTARARIYTPLDTSDPPTMIYLHGIGMEMEMWRAQADPVNALAGRAGIRVVRPEGPWHGRRMLPGYHGGEPALAFAPKGYLDLIQAWVMEAAQLIQWARATSAGPVLIGGLSLGALTAQIVGTAARFWPTALQPDAMFLICTSGDILEVSFEGAFARGLGVTDVLTRTGWTHEGLARWRDLLEPQGAPVMPPEKVVMLLGSHDSVTPYHGGLALAHRWRIPRRNLFIANRGHFSTPLGLHQDDAPLRRAVDVLRESG